MSAAAATVISWARHRPTNKSKIARSFIITNCVGGQPSSGLLREKRGSNLVETRALDRADSRPQKTVCAHTSFVFDSGSSRTRLPVAANTALHRAGANGGTPGSPTPAGGASLFTICTSTWRGARFMRAT